MVLLLSVAYPLLAQDPGARENESKDDPRARALYLEHKRSGGAPVPAGARQQALRDVDAMVEREGKAYWQSVSQSSTTPTSVSESTAATRESSTAGSPLAISSSQWTPIGPQATKNPDDRFTSGRVTALAVDPNDSNIVYLGAAQGGVWKTIDGGTNWTPMTDQQQSLAIGSLAIDPSNSQIVYAGTGEENFGSDSYYGAGILKFDPALGSWSRIDDKSNGFSGPFAGCLVTLGCGGARIGSISVNPSNGQILIAGVSSPLSTARGIFRSINGGGSWTQVLSGFTPNSLTFATSTVAYAGIDKNGVYKSTDGGANWSSINGSTIVISNTGRVAIAVAPSDLTGQTAYASIGGLAANGDLSGFYRTIDGGGSWTRLYPTTSNLPDYCVPQCWYDNIVVVHPTNPNIVFVGGAAGTGHISLSTDGGTSWTEQTGAIHVDHHAAAFSKTGALLYWGNDGGAYKTTNTTAGPVTWQNLNTNLNITQFYGNFAIDPTNPQIMFGGTQDNGIQQFSGLLAWDNVTCGDGAGAVFDLNISNTVYANCQDIDVRRTTTGGRPFSHIDATLRGSGDRVAFIPPLVGDRANPMGLYFGTDHLWKSTTGGASWNKVSPQDLTGGGTIDSVAISADNDTAYTGSSDGRVFRIAPLTALPVANDVTGTGLPSGVNINSIAISPTDANVAYVAVSGFNDGQHVFKTVSGGGTWTSINGAVGNALSNSPANDIVIDPDLTNTLYVATDVGVFKSVDDGANWTTLQNGLPRVAVFGLKLHRPSRILRAATHGRGMWDLSVPACGAGACITVSPGGLNFGTQPVGTASAPQSVTVTNIGTQPLIVTSVNAGGEYSQTNNCASVPVNGTCTVTATFYPRGGSTRTGGITLMSNGGSPAHVSLSGMGTVIQPNDDFANGAAVTSGAYTNSLSTLTATSQASDPTPPIACVNSYFPADPLGWDPSSGFNHHAVWFSYTPATSGSVNLDTLTSEYDTVLSVWTGAPGSFTSVACNDDAPGQSSAPSQISGMSVTAGTTYQILASGFYAAAGNLALHLTGPSPVVGFSAPGLSFTALPGHTSGPQSLTMTNNTAGPISISSVAVSGDYSVTHSCPSSLGAGGSCTINVTFAPTTTGQRLGVLSITDTAPGGTQRLPLIGVALDLGLNFVRVATNGTVGSGTLTTPGSRPTRAVRSAADIIVVAGQSREITMELTSTVNTGETVSFTCTGAPAGATCTVEPGTVQLNDVFIPIQVRFNTGSTADTSGSRSLRAKRLATKSTLQSGTYEVQINARVGDFVKSTAVTVYVNGTSSPSRVKRDF